MTTRRPIRLILLVGLIAAAAGVSRAADGDAPLPGGVRAVWDIEKAFRQKTATRDRICLNGLWRWQPAKSGAEAVPAGLWGFFKVPGGWPGITDYMQKDCQTVFTHPAWKDEKLGGVTAAWYQREIAIPGDWAGRRIALAADYVNSYAALYVDGKKAGELRFPGGEVDLTAACKPRGKHVLSMLVVAMPLKGVMLSYNDTASAREVKGAVARRGLCGDVYLVGEPAGPRIADVKVDTSTRKWEITFGAALDGLAPDSQYALRARVRDGNGIITEFTSKVFKIADLQGGRFAFTEKWQPDKLWDIHTPRNTYQVDLSLLDAGGKVLDAESPVRFGFREFWIDGRDFYLNGSRIYLSAVPLDNAQISAGLATYEGAKESMERLKSFGINFVYTHNYGCQPGSHLGFEEVLRAADDVGMLVSFSQPHFGHYDWKAADSDANNGYARHARFYVRAAGSHPSVVMYSMSHNATGYAEDMNPDMIDGIKDPRDQWSARNAKLALRAEAIVKRLDSARIVYHHSSGNLGSMHTVNFYPNFAPIQELSDWLEHWATKGVKPLFTCEYGAPFTWDWAMYRGWYKGVRTFGSATVPWEFCFAEWNAQFLGDRAFQIGEPEKANLRWETKQYKAGRLWHRWDYPYEIGSPVFDDRYEVLAMYLRDNWPAFRAWGLSANSPWEFGHFWKLRPGVDKKRKELKVDWDNLQRPGFSPDYVEGRYERMDLAYERKDWEETPAARELGFVNTPFQAYFAGEPNHFTEKGHIFYNGETVRKQLIVVNNTRKTHVYECSGYLMDPTTSTGDSPVRQMQTRKITLETGQQARIPLEFMLPPDCPAGRCGVCADVAFEKGDEWKGERYCLNRLDIEVLSRPVPPKITGKIALFDPKGETGKWLGGLGVEYKVVDAKADLAGFDVLIIGKHALTVGGAAPDIARVRDGLRVIVFEQTAEVMEKRLGFRATEYGLRQVFPRIPDHPALAGLEADHLRDWRGAATNTSPRLDYKLSPRFNYVPVVSWCGIEVPRVWRCGNWGNVASVLIEKPARGDWLPIVDGGFSLQYSPLMEYREGKGMVLFCQLDVTGRTETDPAAERIARSILTYASAWKPAPARKALYAGEPAGKTHLEKCGLAAGAYDGGDLPADGVLIVGPGGGKALAGSAGKIAEWVKTGGHVLAIGLDEAEARAIAPQIAMKKAEHIAAFFEPFGANSALAGVGPADVHNRDPRVLPLVSGGAEVVGDGVLAQAQGANVVFCQLAPWQFDYAKQYNIKRTYRRASFLVSRLLANMGAGGATPLLERFGKPVDAAKKEGRWLDGLYLDTPEEWDDPYRFFRW